MKFKLIEEFGNQDALENKFLQFSEGDDFNSSSIYIFPSGNVFGFACHEDMIREVTDNEQYEVSIPVWQCNAVRAGDYYDDDLYCVFIELPESPLTIDQYSSIEQYIDNVANFSHKNNQSLSVQVAGIGAYKEYSYADLGASEIIKRIKRFYSSGRLYESIIKESLKSLNGNGTHKAYITWSRSDVVNLIKEKPMLYRILYDTNEEAYLIGDGNEFIHWDMLEAAYNQGLLSNSTYDFIDINCGSLDNYAFNGTGGLISDSETGEEVEYDQYLYYLVVIPSKSFSQDKVYDYIGDSSADGYDRVYFFEDAVICTRDSELEETPLFNSFGKLLKKERL